VAVNVAVCVRVNVGVAVGGIVAVEVGVGVRVGELVGVAVGTITGALLSLPHPERIRQLVTSPDAIKPLPKALIPPRFPPRRAIPGFHDL
jgi:hypothetical protein